MDMRYKTVSVIGLGYIGLPTAAVFAARKVSVIGVDVNQHAVEIINDGKIHIVEPELDMIVHAAVAEGYLRATLVPERADAFLIAVPTPFKNNHEPDLSYIAAAASALAPVLRPGNLVILESTSPVGTTERLAAWLAAARPDLSFPHQMGEDSDIRIAYCPERVLPGHVMRELIENDRIIGGMSRRCSEAASKLYQIFLEGECVVTNARTAEMCKLTENASRDVSIAFANELSLICDKLDINVWELIRLANRHPRVNILQPGPGVGGHCIAVDPWFIVDKTPDESRLIHTARVVNDGKPRWVQEKIRAAVEAAASERSAPQSQIRICCFGLAFKSDIDDLRESPALEIAVSVGRAFPGQVTVIEPNIKQLPQAAVDAELRMIPFEEAFTESDVLVLLVDHKQFRAVRPKLKPTQYLVDTKGIWTQD